MDKGSMMIGLGLILLTALPFIIYNVFKKVKKKKFLKNFILLSEKEKLKLTQIDIWNNCYAIGIDSDSKKLLYHNIKDEKGELVSIDLTEVEQCRLVNTDRLYKINNPDKINNRIEIIFSFVNSCKPEKSLEFYKNAEFLPSVDDISQAEIWVRNVNLNLKSNQN